MSSPLQSTMSSSTNGSEGQNLIAQAGDIVLTNFGIAVCVRSSQTAQPSLFKARLWRVPGKSVGSAAVAFLRHDTVSHFFQTCASFTFDGILFHICSIGCSYIDYQETPCSSWDDNNV
jgi:hypothetical protein